MTSPARMYSLARSTSRLVRLRRQVGPRLARRQPQAPAASPRRASQAGDQLVDARHRRVVGGVGIDTAPQVGVRHHPDGLRDVVEDRRRPAPAASRCRGARGRPRRARGAARMRARRRSRDSPRPRPTKRGSPSTGTARCAASSRWSSPSGSRVVRRSVSPPGVSSSSASPRMRSTCAGSVPRKLKRPHRSAPRTLSRRKPYGPRWIFRKADTGVSRSARISRLTGIRSPRSARARNWSRGGHGPPAGMARTGRISRQRHAPHSGEWPAPCAAALRAARSQPGPRVWERWRSRWAAHAAGASRMPA